MWSSHHFKGRLHPVWELFEQPSYLKACSHIWLNFQYYRITLRCKYHGQSITSKYALVILILWYLIL
jgi:hypothetical protein